MVENSPDSGALACLVPKALAGYLMAVWYGTVSPCSGPQFPHM